MRIVLLFLLALITIQTAFAVEEKIQRRSFKDWHLVCDRLDGCSARSGAPVTQNLIDASMIFTLKRDRFAPNWSLQLTTHEQTLAEDLPVKISLNNQVIAIWHLGTEVKRFGGHNHYYFSPNPAPRLLNRMMHANTLSVQATGQDGSSINAQFSLKGLAESALFIDERQQRIGSERVLELPDNIKAAPDQKTHKAIIRQGVPKALMARHTQTGQCDNPQDLIHGEDIIIAHLSGTRWLYGLPCFAGSYNFSYAFYDIDRERPNQINPLQFARFSQDIGWDGTSILVNALFDPLRRTLIAFDKYRGVGDCGTIGSWIYNGWAFKLVEYSHNGICSDDPGFFDIHKPHNFDIVFEQPVY